MLRNALYTALSRAKSTSGLFVVGNLKLTNSLTEKDHVHLELKRLREHCAIMWSIPLISPDIYLHNVRSLNKHWEDLTVDQLIVQSQVLILQETTVGYYSALGQNYYIKYTSLSNWISKAYILNIIYFKFQLD